MGPSVLSLYKKIDGNKVYIEGWFEPDLDFCDCARTCERLEEEGPPVFKGLFEL